MVLFMCPTKDGVTKPSCNRCGKCCHVLVDGKLVKCKHLVKLPNGKTLCRHYNNRLGQKIAGNFVCGPRETSTFDYPGCPFNTDKPIAPEWREKENE